MDLPTIDQALEQAFRFHQEGDLGQAEPIYRLVLAVAPQHPVALHLLGVIAAQCGRHQDAAVFLERSLAVNPNDAVAQMNYGEIQRALGRFEQAQASHERALALRPDYADAHNNLGMVLLHFRRLEEARQHFERALTLRSDYAEAHINLGNVWLILERPNEAYDCYERALALRPDFCQIHNNLGAVLQRLHRFDEARRFFEQALALAPNFPDAHRNLGTLLRDLGETEASLGHYRRALDLQPESASAHSTLIFALNFDPETDPDTLRSGCNDWDRQHALPLRASLRPHTNDPDPQRRLRIGYVSADFRIHAVSYFITPLLAAHDHAQVEVHCYSSTNQADASTNRLQHLVGGWHDIASRSDEAVAEQIRADSIDILVDLGLHTSENRLLVFARQPAPVQVSWLGCPGSTGLESIAFRLTDARMEPAGGGESQSREEPVCLPDCWCCFDPLEQTPPVGGLPALTNTAPLTFGALNNFSKVQTPTLRLWGRVLAAVPGSRLLLRCPPGRARERTAALLRERGGIEAGRLEFVGHQPTRDDYLRLYQRVDVALDTAPYNGMTTTCEALWMGVPVITLPGMLSVSRAGFSLLSTVGLEEFVARDETDYVRIAAFWAGHLPQLAALRAGLRERMRRSPLMDAPRFARHVEAAYRMMWQRWCEAYTILPG